MMFRTETGLKEASKILPQYYGLTTRFYHPACRGRDRKIVAFGHGHPDCEDSRFIS